MMNLFFGSLVFTCAGSVPFAGFSVQEVPDGFEWDCPAMGYLPCRDELLVSTQQLAQMIDEGAAILVHVGFDEAASPAPQRVRYSDGHLPGARHLIWTDLEGSKEEPKSLGSHLEVFQALGISPGDRVVFYDTGLGFEAAAAYAALDALGLAGRAALLDGQWSKWAIEGRPLSQAQVRARPCALFSEPSKVRMDPVQWARLYKDPVLSPLGVTLIDARSGPSSNIRRRPIPGPIVRMSWLDQLASPNFPVLRREVELRRLWTKVPAAESRLVVAAARDWVEAAPVYFAARLLGYSAMILDASIEEGEEVENPS